MVQEQARQFARYYPPVQNCGIRKVPYCVRDDVSYVLSQHSLNGILNLFRECDRRKPRQT